MSETTALEIAKQYPNDKYNLLVPIKTFQELSPLHKLVINEVQIDPSKESKDTYSQNGELALTKKALMKLMAAANIQIIDSHTVPTQRCNKCIEIAKVTRLAPKCSDCAYIDDVAVQVTIAVPEPSGTYRMVRATKELRMEDEKPKYTSDKTFAQFKQFKTEHCESKALNRALREGLMIKSTYTLNELKKPFAVALVMPNMSDPDLKKAMIERYANNASALYGTGAPQLDAGQANMQALPESNITIIDTDEPDDIDLETGEVTPPSQEIIDITDDDFIMDEEANCSECGAELQPFTDKKGTAWTVQDIVDYSMGQCNRILCIACAVKEIKAKQRAEKEAGGK